LFSSPRCPSVFVVFGAGKQAPSTTESLQAGELPNTLIHKPRILHSASDQEVKAKVLECVHKANSTRANASRPWAPGSSGNFPGAHGAGSPGKPAKGIPHTGGLLQAPQLARGGGSALRAEQHELTAAPGDARDEEQEAVARRRWDAAHSFKNSYQELPRATKRQDLC